MTTQRTDLPTMTSTGGGAAGPGGTTTDMSSTGATPTETAKHQAAEVGRTATEAGGQVAATAKDEALHVAAEARTQARDLLDRTQTQAREQAGVQQQKAAGGLLNLSNELRALSEGRPAEAGSGIVAGLAGQAADSTQQVAKWLESREPGDLLMEIRDLARRRPGAFLLGAAAAGVLAGRLTRGAVDANRSTSDSPPNTGAPTLNLGGDTVVADSDPFAPGANPPVVGGERP